MDTQTTDFSLEVQGVKGFCPAGEVYAKQQIEKHTIPVLSCEGPCIRGDIARLAANYVAQDMPSFARAPVMPRLSSCLILRWHAGSRRRRRA